MSTDSVAQDQIRAFVDRILRLKEEASNIKGDIREVYAEAKANGFDKTVLGKLVSYVEKRAAGAADLQEAEALFDLYLSAYDGASHTHAREDEPEHDDDGVVIESTAARKDVQLKAGREGHNTSQREAERSGGRAPSGTEAGSPSANQVQGAGTQAPPVDTSSQTDGDVGRSLPVLTGTSSAGTEGEADRQPIPTFPADAEGSRSTRATDVGIGGEAPTTVTPLFRINPLTHFANSKGLPRLHGCQRPETCGGSHRALCGTCARAAGQGSAA